MFTGDNKLVEPNPLCEGFARYNDSEMEDYVFEFLLNYVRRVKSDVEWKKLLKKNPEKPFMLFVTPSDIAFIPHKYQKWIYKIKFVLIVLIN